MRSRLPIIALILAVVALAALAAGPGAADTWQGSITGGFSGDFEVAQPEISSVAVADLGDGTRIYTGTLTDSGCRVYEYDPATEESVEVSDPGFGNVANREADSMAVHDGDLYVGTRNEVTGCEVWRYDGVDWTRTNFFGGFGDLNNTSAVSLAVYGGNLYAGTENDASQGGNGCEVWRYGGLFWEQVNANGFGFLNNRSVTAMTILGGNLIAGTENAGNGCQLWQYDSSVWTALATNGFGDAANTAASSLAAFDPGTGTKLYVGTANSNGCELWEYGTPPTLIDEGGFTGTDNRSVSSMAVFADGGSKLFMGTQHQWADWNGCQVFTYDISGVNEVPAAFGARVNQGAMCAAVDSGGPTLYFGTLNDPMGSDVDRGTGCELWRYSPADPTPWKQVNDSGYTTSNNYMVSAMVTMNNDVYAGTASASGCEVWRFDGSDWSRISPDVGLGDPGNSMVSSLAVYDYGGGPSLYAGTFNTTGCQVWRFDGPDPEDWTRVSAGSGIEVAANRSASSMVAYLGVLYVGTYNSTGCEVWSYQGAGPLWTKLVGSGVIPPGLGPGFGDPNNVRASSACASAPWVYFGALNWSTGCEVWRFDTSSPAWQESASGGFGDADNNDVLSMASFGGRLFAGTNDWTDGAAVFGHDPAVGGWAKVSYDGFSSGQSQVASLAANEGRLFAGTAYGCGVYASSTADDPDSWSQVNTDGFAGTGNSSASAMAVRQEGLGGNVYAGTLNPDYGAEVHATVPSIDDVYPATGVQGDTVTVVVTATNTHFGAGSTLQFTPAVGITVDSTNVIDATHLAADITIDQLAQAGTRDVNVLTPGETPDPLVAGFTVLLPGAPSIQAVSPAVAGQGTTLDVLITGQNTHFIQGHSAATFSGSGVTVNSTTVTDIEHATANVTIPQAAQIGPRDVNVITTNETPAALRNGFYVVYGQDQAWYLAEGCTANGFETWVLVQNPNNGSANVNLTYMTPTGAVPGPAELLPPGSRKTFNVADTVPGQTDVSTMITSDRPVIAERSMYCNNRSCADDSIGTSAPATTWYLAEGSTGPGYDSWVLVQNPNAQAVNVKLTYMTAHGAVAGPEVGMAANTRKSFKVNNSCPGEWQVSTRVDASGPVVAERSIYCNDYTWATESVGASQPSESWYLAEGSTGPGFETWVLVQNPGNDQAAVTLKYQTPTGQKEGPSFNLPALSRTTVNVADMLPGEWSVSTVVTSSEPVVAERAMYGNGRKWGHDSIGTAAPHDSWCLPEGSTGPGFETWVLVQNPNAGDATVTLTYMTPSGPVAGPTAVLGPGSRRTFNVADSVGSVWEVSTALSADKPVIAERSMYGGGRWWGTDSIGCPW